MPNSFCNISEDSLFEYRKECGEIIITAYTGDNEHAAVPDSINGLPVVSLDKGAFYKKKELISVTLPNTIRSFKRMAFCKCCNLSEVNTPSQLTDISSDVFTNCVSLNKFELPHTLRNIGSAAFSVCESLTQICQKVKTHLHA